VVPNLNTSGAFPEDHTPHLLLLINQYFVLQEIRADFHLFQEELRLFTDRLYTSPIELVNQLYGAQFAVGSQRYYLFQLLIVLHGATTYCLDDQLRDVLKWLYLSDPRWWIEHHSLNEVYAEVDRTRPLRLPVQKSLGTCEYQECMCMLLSLYTYKFETSSLFRQEISILDKVNLIPCKLAAIEAEFAPVLKSKEGIGLLDVYTNQKKNTIIPCAEHSGQSSSWASYLDSNVNAKIWCTKVLNREWLDLGVTWYDPKLLIHALVRFRPRSKGNTDAINLFIDGLIQTYTQSASKLQKQLRVNILFGDLLTSLGTNSSEHKLLLMWVSIFSRHDYKGNFLSNCIYHVGNRLHEISVVSLATSSGFFAAVTALDPHIKFNISSLHIESVRESIDEFKREIQSIESQINPELRNKLISYLQKLGEVIITVEQRVAAEQSGRFGDPFAAPS